MFEKTITIRSEEEERRKKQREENHSKVLILREWKQRLKALMLRPLLLSMWLNRGYVTLTEALNVDSNGIFSTHRINNVLWVDCKQKLI